MSFFQELKRRNVVRVGVAYAIVAWLLIQLAGALEPALLLPDWVDRVVAVFVIIGFPIVLLFAWAFELTPDGIKLTKDVSPDESITGTTGKKLEYTTIALLGIVVIFFLGREFIPTQEGGSDPAAGADAQPASIAVLPFEDYSEAKDQDFFSKGISEEILNLLAKTNALRVAARTSSFAFSGAEMDIRDIGEKLDVETVLEGSIRKSGPNIRITAQLINVEDGYHIWSETYDRNYADIFRIQDEIAAEILTALKVHLLGEVAVPSRTKGETTVNMDAYNAYLIGKERLALRTKADIEAAHHLFETALEIDPEFAPAHVNLAHADLLLERWEFGGDGNIDPTHDKEIKEHLEIALRLAPELPEAIAVHGYYQLRRHKIEEAEASFNRALQLNPNYALAYTWRAETAYQQDRYLDMLADKEKAYALDPMSLEICSDLAYEYRSFWRPRDAERVIERMFALHPDHPLAYNAKLENLHAHGRLGEALLTVDEALAAHPDNEILQNWQAWLLLQIGLIEEAIATGDHDAEIYGYLMQGRYDDAQAVIDAGLVEPDGPHWFWHARDALHLSGDGPADPEFASLLDRQIEMLDQNQVPWRERCMNFLIRDLNAVGRDDDAAGMMTKCHEAYEERLKAQYLCPCSFYGLVFYTFVDGRIEEGLERMDEWLSNGDSMSWLAHEPAFFVVKDRPEFHALLARNEEQLERQRQIYKAGLAPPSDTAHP
jgi:TolB-like protein/Flp pilus assembly protein TadD